jgi:dienelactone hydrolase
VEGVVHKKPLAGSSVDDLRESLGSFLNVSLSAPAPKIHSVYEVKEEGYTRSLIRYTAPDGEEIKAFLLEPDGNCQGAIVALHQHNSQWEMGKGEIAGLAGDPQQAFGPALALRGITVLAPDAIGFESRMKKAGAGASLAPNLDRPNSSAESWLQYYNQMAHRLVCGDLLMKKILDDSSLALTVLQERTKIERLGTIGHSFGGIIALFLAALDTRIAYVCTSGALCSFRHKLANGTGLEMSLIIPGFAEKFDVDDLVRCVAPREILVVSATDDPQSADADKVVKNAFKEFASLGCPAHLEHLRVSGGHPLDPARFDAIIEWAATQAARS